MNDNTYSIILVSMICGLFLFIIALEKCDADPLYITWRGEKGYFIPEEEFKDILLVFSDLKYYKNTSALLTKRKNEILRELWITRGVTVLSLTLSIVHSIMREVGR